MLYLLLGVLLFHRGVMIRDAFKRDDVRSVRRNIIIMMVEVLLLGAYVIRRQMFG